MSLGEPNLESLTHFLQMALPRYQHTAERTWQNLSPRQREEHWINAASAQGRQLNYPNTPELVAAWERAAEIYRTGCIVKGIVTGWNRGGLLVRWEALQGFVPASQLKEMPIFEDDEARDEKLARWVGEELNLKVIELDPSRNRLVFSERATIWGPKDCDQLLLEIMPGQVRRGYVSNLCDFGAFVDLGGVDGLIHISELSWGRVSHPRELLSLGQEIEAYVMHVDRENRRIALSLKRLRPDPWTIVNGKYRVGQVVEVVITNVVDFGAFARLEEGLEGLIHVSELAETNVHHPSEVLHPGDKVRARILRIDSANHRLGLSIRQAVEGYAEPLPDPQPPTDPGGPAPTHFLY